MSATQVRPINQKQNTKQKWERITKRYDEEDRLNKQVYNKELED